MTVLHSDLGFSQEVVNSYMAQLYLRKRMNEISGQLYNPKHKLELEEQLEITKNIEQTLEGKDVWAMKFSFNVHDPPADDILHARFRAKFWGANVITYRPYVESVLRWSHRKRHPEEYRDSVQRTFQNEANLALSVPSEATTPSEIPRVVIEYARKALWALGRSTEAFHGLRDKRFIITNIFGTAHA